MNKEESLYMLIENVLGLSPNSISNDSKSDDFDEWDSLNIINLMLSLKEEFKIEITIDEAVEMLDVKNIISMLENKKVF